MTFVTVIGPMVDSTVDQEILSRVRAGDKSGYALCIETYGDRLFRLALRLMQNEADADHMPLVACDKHHVGVCFFSLSAPPKNGYDVC